MVSIPKATHRARRIAYEPRLDLALRASVAMRFRGRGKLRPNTIIEVGRGDRVTSITARAQLSTSSIGSQFAFTGGGGGGLAGWPDENGRIPGSGGSEV